MEDHSQSWRHLPPSPPEGEEDDSADDVTASVTIDEALAGQATLPIYIDDAYAFTPDDTAAIGSRSHSMTEDPRPTSPRPWFLAFIGGLAGALVAIGAIAFTGNLGAEMPVVQSASADRVIERPVILASESPDRVAAVAARAVPSVVSIQIYAIPGEPNSLAGSGSGVIFDSDGMVLTNSHVVEGASEIKVALSDGRTYSAELIGRDPVTDIAVVSIPATGLPVIDFATQDIQIGDLAVAVGNPLGLEGGPSVTSGVVSAFNRELEVDPLSGITLYGLLQTDAPITRGSSGGALVNDRAALLGITTAIGVSD
ncbi:MAG: trypsin-like peptidase domain-containing protein, partial [Acidimicrobiia bacterium]|nr:trypsin-like peptidase domain-containing protein [Acidimicrobiia bacterium]